MIHPYWQCQPPTVCKQKGRPVHRHISRKELHFIHQVSTFTQRKSTETVSEFGMFHSLSDALLQRRAPLYFFTRIEPKNEPDTREQFLMGEHAIAPVTHQELAV